MSFTKKYDTLGIINQSGVGFMLEKNIEDYLIKQLQGLKYIYRYLTTEKPEEPIDLYAVNKKLIEIKKAIRKTQNMRNEFLKRQGLPVI